MVVIFGCLKKPIKLLKYLNRPQFQIGSVAIQLDSSEASHAAELQQQIADQKDREKKRIVRELTLQLANMSIIGPIMTHYNFIGKLYAFYSRENSVSTAIW